MKDKLNNHNIMSKTKALETDKETQLLKNIESAHLKKKAAFDELLRYTYNSIKETNNSNSDMK